MNRLLFLFILLGCVGARLTANAQGITPAQRTRMAFVLDSIRENTPSDKYGKRYPASFSVAMIRNDDVWTYATGWASRTDSVKATPETVYRIYSSTKTFTAALIMALVGEGRLTLDDQIQQHIPMYNTTLDSTVNIRQLLTHASGFDDYTDSDAFAEAIILEPYRRWKPTEVVTFSKKWFPKDSLRKYSSTNYIYLGLIAQKVLGQDTTVEAAIRSRFFNKVGMPHAYMPYNEDSLPFYLAKGNDDLSGYFLTPPNKITEITAAVFPYDGIVSAAWTTGCIVTNAEDLCKWGYNLWSGKVLNKAMTDSVLHSIDNANGDDDYPGYGIYTANAVYEGFVGHGGASIGYRSTFGYHKGWNMGIALLTNHGSASLDDICHEMLYEITGERPVGRAEDLAEAGFLKYIVSPNPANTQADISVYLTEAKPVELSVYNALGQPVQILTKGALAEGIHSFTLDVSVMPKGVYFVRLKSGALLQSKTLLVD